MLTRAQAVAELERIYEILPQIASALADVRKPVAQYAKTSYFKDVYGQSNVGENDKVIIGAAAYIYQNVEDYVCGARKIDKELIEMSKCGQKLIKILFGF